MKSMGKQAYIKYLLIICVRCPKLIYQKKLSKEGEKNSDFIFEKKILTPI